MTLQGSHLVRAASWALVGALFVVPLTLGRNSTAPDLVAHIVLSVLCGVAVVGILLSGRPRPRWRRSDWCVVALVGVYVVSSFTTVHPRGTLADLMRLADYLALYWLVRTLLRGERMLLAGTLSLALGTGAAAAMGVQEYLKTAVVGDTSWRAFGPFYNPNILASALMMGIPLWLALVKPAKLPVHRLATVVALAVCLLGFFATGSKGGALALMGALLVGAVIAPDPAREGALKRVAIGVGLVVLLAAAAMLVPSFRVRVLSAFGSQSNSMMFRYYTWLGTWHMFLANPLLGFGPGTFTAAYPRFAVVGHTLMAHQTYLQVAAEAGALGLAALVSVLGTRLWHGFQGARQLTGLRRSIAVAATVGMVAFCLHNVVDYAWHITATGMAFWVLAGLARAALDGEPDQETGPAKPRRVWLRIAVPAAVALLSSIPAAMALRAASLASHGQLRQAASWDPLNDIYRRQIAMATHDAARRGDERLYDQALRYWHYVEFLRPTHPGTPYNRGLINEDLGRPDEAVSDYREAIELSPTWTKPYVALGQLYEDLGRRGEALEVYRRLDELSTGPLFDYPPVAEALDPNFAYAWLALGDEAPLSEARDLYVKACKYLRRVMGANRIMEGVWRNSGEWEQRQSPELARLAEEAAQRNLNIGDPGPRLRAALLLIDAGRSTRSAKAFIRDEDAAGRFEDMVEAWSYYVSASHLLAQRQLDRSDDLFILARQRLGDALQDADVQQRLREGPHGWRDGEFGGFERLLKKAEECEAAKKQAG